MFDTKKTGIYIVSSFTYYSMNVNVYSVMYNELDHVRLTINTYTVKLPFY